MADNRRIAAIAAALATIQAEGSGTAAAAQPGMAQPGVQQRQPPGGGSGPGPWALYGRQRIMTMRALMQRRALLRRL
jgi:hypothetical protein